MCIQSSDGFPLGLLLMFNPESRRPTPAEVTTLDMIVKLARICIDHHNTTRQLSHLVRHDALTGLPNRLLFEDRVQQSLALARRSGAEVAVMVLDIDRFKSINDSYGHNAGDHLLQQFAQRLRSQLRESDTMARIGGDEFVVVLPELTEATGVASVAQKLMDSLIAPFEIGSARIVATTSIGIALFPDDGEDALTLREKADAALYRVKNRGRNGYGV